MRQNPIHDRVVRAALLSAALVLAGCQDSGDGLAQARDAIARGLPAPYFEDLVTESVAIDGHRLVFLVRSPTGDAVKTRQAPGFDALRDSEQREMQTLCSLPAIQPLIGTEAVLVRRFVDQNGTLFFETELPARECPAPPA
ncbi:hypothetical protein SAMN05428982_3064 [Pseudoxanthomonas sp. CF385]|uniref:hypothetical protein n=1 Tax=Pseudoxanthomonas sp. CF385 TaxID=1881042 RepID=UPI0008856858|nr:hypothetical protein [Pseudoxanthomonas sp. CF385]SDR05030.1 hypothetical protein SAMN05428982_3064 [Pseudoxanthomonas sp. CF385]